MTKNDVAPRRPKPAKREAIDAAATSAQAANAEAGPARQRIAKVIARAGLCSRRDAEAWITAGRVTVNGEVLSSPARDVGRDDEIMVDDAPLPAAEKTRLFLFHKPRGLVTSDHDPEGRETVTDFLRENWPEGPRVVTVGRLDINTEGLLLLTNDGGLARVLELPDTGWLRRYRVRAKGEADQSKLDALAAGIEIDGIHYAGIEAKLDRVQGSNCWLTMGLREGKNREIKRVLEHLGMGVNRLIRISFGPFQLLDLPEGAVEEVRTRVLRDQLGDSLAKEAGVRFDDGAVVPAQADAPQPSAARGDGRNRTRISVPPSGVQSRPRDDSGEPSIERPERPPGPRRHVAALRATEDQKLRNGPRKRIERTDTKDRRDRTVVVERHMLAQEAPSRTGKPGRAISPSAEAKRVRIARSGGGERLEQQRSGERVQDRRPRSGTRDAQEGSGKRRNDRISPFSNGRGASSGEREPRRGRDDARPRGPERGDKATRPQRAGPPSREGAPHRSASRPEREESRSARSLREGRVASVERERDDARPRGPERADKVTRPQRAGSPSREGAPPRGGSRAERGDSRPARPPRENRGTSGAHEPRRRHDEARPRRPEREGKAARPTRAGQSDRETGAHRNSNRPERAARPNRDGVSGKGEQSRGPRSDRPSSAPRSGPRPASRGDAPSERSPRGGPRGPSKPKR